MTSYSETVLRERSMILAHKAGRTDAVTDIAMGHDFDVADIAAHARATYSDRNAADAYVAGYTREIARQR